MDSTHVDGNNNNSSKMEKFDNCTDDRPCVYETIISGGFINEELQDTDNKQRRIHNNITTKDENIDDWTVLGFINENSCDTEYKHGNIDNYVSIKDKSIDDMIVVVPETELITDCTDDDLCQNEVVIDGRYVKQELCDMNDEQGSIKNYTSKNVVVPETELITNCTDDEMCLNEPVISGGYIKQEPCDMKTAQGRIHDYLDIKDENIDDLTVIAQETELTTDGIDSKVCVYETIISGGYIKQEPCDTEDESGSIHNNVNMKACEECGEKYDLYCLKCPMLTRIFHGNNPDGTDNRARWTLPKNFIDIHETPSCVGIVALRIVPKGVVCGPFKGLDSTKDDTVSKWKLRNKELAYTKDCRQLNWMQYIRKVDQNCDANLTPFQYEHELYYRSECRINVGDELLVRWNSDSKESEIENCYWEPVACERLDDSYACMLCCVGYKSMSHLKAHNSTCIEKRNKKEFSGEIVRCDVCKIYLDKKEYSDYHMDRCYKSNEKCVFKPIYRRNSGRPLQHRIDNGDRPFSCILCPYKTKRKADLKKHIAIHDGDKPFACTLCSYTTRTNWKLKQHVVLHNNDKPFECILCPYKAKTKSMLKQHVAIHNDDKPFECSLCPYKAKTKSTLKQHVAVHNDDKPFECSLCPYKTKTMSMLKKHIAVHNKDKPFECILCPYKAKTKSVLKQHASIHNCDKPFACTLCPYKAKTKTMLKLHVVVHNDDKPFACSICSYKTKTKSLLKQHVAVHNDNKSYECTLCSYKAKTKWMLEQHIAGHNDNKPFACILCSYKATTNSNLKQHIVIHNSDKPYACTLCPYKTARKSILKQHFATHNGDKPFSCTLCPFKATRKSNMKKHIAAHNDEVTPFTCTLCSYKAKTNMGLKQHVAYHNENDMSLR